MVTVACSMHPHGRCRTVRPDRRRPRSEGGAEEELRTMLQPDYISHISQLSRRLDEIAGTLHAERSARLAMERQLRETAAELATVRLQMEIRAAAVTEPEAARLPAQRPEADHWRSDLRALEARLADSLMMALEQQQRDAAAHHQALTRQQETASAEQREALSCVRRLAEEVQRGVRVSEDREAEIERERELWLLAMQPRGSGGQREQEGIAEAVRKLEDRVMEVGKVTQQSVSAMGEDIARASARQAVAAVEERLRRWEDAAHALEEQVQKVQREGLAQYGLFSNAVESRISVVDGRLSRLQSTVQAISTMAAEAAAAEADAAEADLRERDIGAGRLSGLASTSSHKELAERYSRAMQMPQRDAQPLALTRSADTVERLDRQRSRSPSQLGPQRQASTATSPSYAAGTPVHHTAPGMALPMVGTISSILHASPQGRYRWPGDGPISGAADASPGVHGDRKHGGVLPDAYQRLGQSPPSSPVELSQQTRPPQQQARHVDARRKAPRAGVARKDTGARTESTRPGGVPSPEPEPEPEPAAPPAPAPTSSLPEEWPWIEEFSDEHGRNVYRHRGTGETTLTRPGGRSRQSMGSNGSGSGSAQVVVARVNRTEHVSLTKSSTEGFGMEIGDGAVVLSVSGPAAGSNIATGWVIVGVSLEGEHWPTNESRATVVQLLSTVAPGGKVGFTFEVTDSAQKVEQNPQ